MGRALTGFGRRTALAAALTAAAVAVPCLSWYLVGSREAAREAARLEETPRRSIAEAGAQLSETLGRRLEALRESESRRPFYHYQSLYHDPKGASEGASVVPSPLAEGPPDPFVRAHFQIAASGRLTLPTINEDEGVPVAEPELARAQREVLAEIQPAVQLCLAAARTGGGPNTLAPMNAESADRRRPISQRKTDSVKLENLPVEAWTQNVQANQLYTQLQQRRAPIPTPPASLRRMSGQREVLIRVGAFGWHTVPLATGPGLVALRDVITPDGRMVQGFLVSPEAVADLLRGSAFPARLLPGPPAGETESVLPLEGTRWRVVLDGRSAFAAAQGRAAVVQADFRRFFLVGTVAAGVAVLFVVLLVWQAEQLARRRSELAASAAHELRTPLAGLRMYSEMLAEGLGDPARSRDYAARIAAEAERLGRVVANLLGFTRLERRSLTIRPQPGNLGEAVRTGLERQREALQAAGMQVEVSIPEDLPELSFDRDAVLQILQNLLDNAEKHTRGRDGRRVRVSLERELPGVTLSVTDNGPGIPLELRRRLFRPFARSASSGAPEGLGLGLALVRALARAHGGDVTAREAQGGGTVMKVSLPVGTAELWVSSSP